MTRMASPMRRVLWLLGCAVLLGAPLVDARDPALAADFDGDGQRDHVTLSGEDSSVLHIWLSATGTTEIIRSREPVLHVVAADLDDDRRPELIASGRTAALGIWARGSHGFRAFRPRRAPAIPDFNRPTHRTLDDGPFEPLQATSVSAPLAPWPASRTDRGAPMSPARRHAPAAESDHLSKPFFTHVGPRPPPAPSV